MNQSITLTKTHKPDTVNRKYNSLILFLEIAFLLTTTVFGQTTNNGTNDLLQKIKNAYNSGTLHYKLTEPYEIKDLLGAPVDENEKRDGGYDIFEMHYPGIQIIFGKQRIDPHALYALLNIYVNGERINIGQNDKLVLRNNNDLKKLDSFYGLQSVSLINVDLQNETDILSKFPFDTETEWPNKDKLPVDFDPLRLIEEGKNPGLRIKELHVQGITGNGVGIAVIDQPLLLGHEEYGSNIIRYDAAGMTGIPPQMHGSPIASIAVGKNIGVAPEAGLSYFAIPTWEKDNSYFTHYIRRVIELNKSLPKDELIRVISISHGGFKRSKGFEELQQAIKNAEKNGIFIIACDTSMAKFGTLNLILGQDPDSPESYAKGKYTFSDDKIRVPAANKTVASHVRSNAYTFERMGGRSWCAPYIAGLAAMAFQIKPNISPNRILTLMEETAVHTSAGPVINPKGFIEKVKSIK